MVTYSETETRQETNSSFDFNRNNNSTLIDNQLDFSSAMPTYSSYSSYQTPTIEKEEEATPSYEVEREYNIEKLPEDEVIIPTFMPTLKLADSEIVSKNDYKIKLNARGKIIASVFGIVVSLLVAFIIYNAVVISNLTNNLADLKIEQANKVAGITQLETSYINKTSKDNMQLEAGGLGFGYSSSSEDKHMNLEKRPDIQEPKQSTNWFNNICEFFSECFR